ncbi:GyrI-like domain-containing protein [Antrihabitans cavernicola]|uniref:AraC family transcriptional regulator n=1 Tax=Antrihabitans cavernicola TaxID=2495913 RepID=A0A5A7S3R5_9NOCA|nr:GyrI-like domain-containing protein [Spelaeibacter cavernicola]KAA0018469.1 AraC family transcriptional regulator [Spelaeibacter cavernicola]
MDFEKVQLPDSYVAGLTIPLAGKEVTRRDLDLVNFTWDRYLAREKDGPRVAAYVAQDGRSAAVLGYECGSLDEAEPGDVVTRIPAGAYAKFVVAGKPYDLTRTAWAEVVKAENEGRITRTHNTDIERFVDATSVEVYVSILA